MNQAEIIRAYAEVARPTILIGLPSNSCIASTRITIECLSIYGVKAKPVAAKWYVGCAELKKCVLVGFGADEMAAARRGGASIGKGLPVKIGWNSHLVAVTGDYLIDPSFDQAPETIGICMKPEMLVLPMPGCAHAGSRIEATITIEDEGESLARPAERTLHVRYWLTRRMDFYRTPAWEMDHLQPVIEIIHRKMERRLKENI